MKSLHVLVVDDNELKRLLLAETAMLFGMDVTSATSGVEAVEALNSNCFDLVLLDYYLEDCTGDQVLAKVEQSTDDQKRPYFVLASNDLDKCRSFKSLGFDSSFEPPFNPNMLVFIVREMEGANVDRRTSPALSE